MNIVILIILILLFLSSIIINKNNIETFGDSGDNDIIGVPDTQNIQNINMYFILHYTVPVDGIYKWPLLYLIETPNNADYFNSNTEYMKPPPGVLSGSNKYKEYPENIFNFSILYSQENIFLAGENTIPPLPKGAVNIAPKEILNKGDSPYFVININRTNINIPLENNNKYVLGIGLQLDKDYVNINGSIRYSKDPLIKYRYINFRYFDFVFNNNNIKIIYPGNTNFDEIKNINLLI